MTALRKHFRPEFLNRVDDIIVFHKLGRAQVRAIAGLMIAALQKKLADQSISVTVSEKAVDALAEKGFSETWGARPLRREIESSLENRLSLMIIEKKLGSGQAVAVDHDGAEFSFEVR